MVEKTHTTTRFGAKFLATAGAFALVVAGVAISAPANAAMTWIGAPEYLEHVAPAPIKSDVTLYTATVNGGPVSAAATLTAYSIDPLTGAVDTTTPADGFGIVGAVKTDTNGDAQVPVKATEPLAHGYYSVTVAIAGEDVNVVNTIVRFQGASDALTAVTGVIVLTEGEKIPDDANAPRITTASGNFWNNIEKPKGSIPGVEVDSVTGILSGTPTTSMEQASLDFTYTPFAGQQATLSVPIVVNEAPFKITSEPEIKGEVGSAVKHQITTNATGDQKPTFGWRAGDSIPEGLTLNSEDGTISGHLLELTFPSVNFTVTATLPEDETNPALQEITLTVNAAEGDKQFTTDMLELKVENGAVVNHRFVVNASLSTVEFTITEGVLPKGLELNAASGLLSGTVDDADGVYPFTVTATITPIPVEPAALPLTEPTVITQAATITVGEVVPPTDEPVLPPTDDATVPPVNGGGNNLASTGSSVPFVATGIALLAALAGAVVLVVRRRQDV